MFNKLLKKKLVARDGAILASDNWQFWKTDRRKTAVTKTQKHTKSEKLLVLDF